MGDALRVLVTGASHGGIGGAVARRFATGGVRIAISATGGVMTLDDLAAELENQGAQVMPLTGDLEDPYTPARFTERAAAFCGGLDLVVSCAGRGGRGELTGLALADWESAMGVHARAPWLLARAAYLDLKESKGSFIAIGSVSGTSVYPGAGAYPVAKAALIALCRQLALEWAPAGVRVNTVSPGLVSTARSPKATAGQIIPLGRTGTPEDIAAIVAFLASPAAAYITGQDIVADGGLAALGLAAALGWPGG
jgi:NAD(P)-dependent dehydrogenase (short-subunit alcohol dehydrogenase family)